MGGYGQFCPIATTAEVLTERWVPLVVRELMCGSTRFNDIGRGVPRMSPSLLSARLKSLERAGVVRREEKDRGVAYHLTAAGEELGPILMAMGEWGQRWARGDVHARNFDASLLLWDMHRCVVADALPGRRVVAHFDIRGSTCKRRHFWLVLEPGVADVCLTDPGHEVDVDIATHVRSLVTYWMGSEAWDDLVRSGDIDVRGERQMVRAFPTWFTRSAMAHVAPASA
ncbi:MAG: helix-turn-helix domain-containing protein [Actinomycetota bacterium]|nr:helix-turn-helix domain-containing protein [Actinomycetota bacterium]